MSLISKCIGRTHDGAGVYELAEAPARFACGWNLGMVLRGGSPTFDTREAAELAWEIAPMPMKLSEAFHSHTADMLRYGMIQVWKEAYSHDGP